MEDRPFELCLIEAGCPFNPRIRQVRLAEVSPSHVSSIEISPSEVSVNKRGRYQERLLEIGPYHLASIELEAWYLLPREVNRA